jgi:transcriptional regulator with XRE-family HTH domain
MFLVQEFSKNVKRFRTLKGISQHGLAAALGVSPQTVSKWECGRGVPDIENLCLLAQLLGVSVDALLDGSLGKKKIMIGIDGGGSKTEFLLFTEDGMILGRALRGGCSPTIIGLEACADLLADGIEELLAVHSGVSAVLSEARAFIRIKTARRSRICFASAFRVWRSNAARIS